MSVKEIVQQVLILSEADKLTILKCLQMDNDILHKKIQLERTLRLNEEENKNKKGAALDKTLEQQRWSVVQQQARIADIQIELKTLVFGL